MPEAHAVRALRHLRIFAHVEKEDGQKRGSHHLYDAAGGWCPAPPVRGKGRDSVSLRIQPR